MIIESFNTIFRTLITIGEVSLVIMYLVGAAVHCDSIQVFAVVAGRWSYNLRPV